MEKDQIVPIQPQAIQPQTPAPIATTELLALVAKRLSEQPEQHIHYHITQVQPTSHDDNARTLLQALSGLAIVLLFFFGAVSVTVLIWQGIHVATSEIGGQ